MLKKTSRLWGAGMIELRHDTRSPRYVPRSILCRSSGRFKSLLPAERTWPIIKWTAVFLHFKPEGTWFWGAIDNLLEFLFTGTLPKTSANHATLYVLGAELELPSYQNAVLMSLAKIDQDSEDSFLSSDKKLSGKKNAIRGDFFMAEFFSKEGTVVGSEKLISYIVDRYIWESEMGGKAWLDVVDRGGIWAQIVAQAKVEAAKRKLPPRYPPWNVNNLVNYLLDDSQN